MDGFLQNLNRTALRSPAAPNPKGWGWSRCTQPTPPGASRMRKPSVTRGSGRGFCLAHARVSEVERPPTHRFLPRTALAVSSSFYHPCKDTSSTPSRAAAPASGPRRAVRAPVGDAAGPFRWRTGSTDAGGSHCSLVGTSWLVPQCRGWGRSSRRMLSLGSSCAPLGEGLHLTRWPSTAQHDRPAPPVRRVALRADRRR